MKALAFIVDLEPGIEVGIAPEPLAHELPHVVVAFKGIGVRMKRDQGAVLFVGVALLFCDQLAVGKGGPGKLAVAKRGYFETVGQGIDRLGAHPVEPHGKLEHLGVVLGPGIDHAHTLNELAQGDTAPEIPHLDHAVRADIHVDPLAHPHDELVHRIVYHLFEEDVDAVVRMAAVAEPTDVHAGPQADMFQGTESLDLAFVVDGCGIGTGCTHRVIGCKFRI
jgi:hypothetical protein